MAYVTLDSPAIDWWQTWKWSWENQWRRSAGYLLRGEAFITLSGSAALVKCEFVFIAYLFTSMLVRAMALLVWSNAGVIIWNVVIVEPCLATSSLPSWETSDVLRLQRNEYTEYWHQYLTVWVIFLFCSKVRASESMCIYRKHGVLSQGVSWWMKTVGEFL